MLAGVAIDKWKLDVFKRHLEAAGYTYKVCPGVAGTLLLQVPCDYFHKLQPIIEAAQRECARLSGRPAAAGEEKNQGADALGEDS